MKKHSIILIFLLVISLTSCSAQNRGQANSSEVELWNGFTTAMNVEQVRARVTSVFNVNLREESDGYPVNFFLHTDFSSEGVTLDMELGIWRRSEFTLRTIHLFNRSDIYNEVFFHFLNGHLFAIEINMRYSDDFIALAINNYGQPTYADARRYVYEWILLRRMIIINDTRPSELKIIDRQVKENWDRERAVEEQRRASERIQF
ncbi:MAG: hypothetical protein FWD28_02985 [Treponema sp.]|nr:hypothetical protein [Treponema sp.]